MAEETAPAAGGAAEAAAAQRAGAQDNGDGTVTLANGKVQVLSSEAYKRIKEGARAQGRKAAQAELDEIAKRYGFDSAAIALASLQANGNGNAARNVPSNGTQRRDDRHREERRDDRGTRSGDGERREAAPEAPRPPRQGADRKSWERFERAQKQFERDRDAYRERLNRATGRSRDLQRQLDAREAEMALRENFAKAGVQDLDYVVHTFSREFSGKTEEELKAFDEAKWIADLRAKKPYLFGEVVIPANTGVNGATPPAPQPGDVTRTIAAGEQVDARKMSSQQFAQHLRSRGMNPDSIRVG